MLARLMIVTFAIGFSSAALASGPATFRLTKDATFFEGCFEPCLCFVEWHGTPRGAFKMELVIDEFHQQVYAITDIDWVVHDLGWTITGSGQYTIMGDFILTERIELDLSINGAEPKHFDSDWQIGASYPNLLLTVDANDMDCYDTVITVAAAPAAPGDLDGDGCVTQADLGILLSCFNQSDCGDLDGDGATTQTDLGILLANFGQGWGCR